MVVSIRDPRTKNGWSRIERFSPGRRTEPHQDQQKFKNLGLNQDRKNLSNLGPGQQDFKNLGPVGLHTWRSVDP